MSDLTLSQDEIDALLMGGGGGGGGGSSKSSKKALTPAEESALKALFKDAIPGLTNAFGGMISGKKITLAPDDLARLRTLPIASLTYMPSVRLDEKTIARRFGQPGSRIREKKSGTLHWLYPQHGLDIALGRDDRPVLQYVPPGHFAELLQPLQDSGEVLG